MDKVDLKEINSVDTFKKAKTFWTNWMNDDFNESSIPFDASVKAEKESKCKIEFEIIGEVFDSAIKIAKNNDFGLYVIFASVLSILMSRYSNQDDIFITTPVYRGFHNNTDYNKWVFIGSHVNRDMVYKNFLVYVKNKIKESFENQLYPLGHLLKELELEKKAKCLYRTVLVYDNIQSSEDVKPIIESDDNYIEVQLKKEESGFKGTVTYSTKLYSKTSIQYFAKHFCILMGEVVKNPDKLISECQAFDKEERNRIIYDFNNKKQNYKTDKTIVELFEEQVIKTPFNIALTFDGKSMTYEELNHKANQLAYKLRETGIKPNDTVAIIIERSFEMLIGILGVLKAGGAYVPIDSTCPEERIDYILNDCEPKALLCGIAEIPVKQPVVKLNLFDKNIYTGNMENPERVNSSEDLVYIIYTSGTTGHPKGVMIQHKALNNYVSFYVENKIAIGNYPLYTTISFDLTVTSVYLPLLTGNVLNIYRNTDLGALAYVMEEIFKGDNYAVKITPAHLKIVADLNIEKTRIKYLIVGGEELKNSLAKQITEKFGKDIIILNEYGPTESTVGCIEYQYQYSDSTNGSVLIGKPISNVKAYILDSNKNVLPVGIPGELYLGGDSLACGYINKKELTAKVFSENPLAPGKTIYKTGDMARWLPDGNIEYFGRIDDQVKVRGFRIELDEIENVIRNMKNIYDVAVICKTDESGNRNICAYIVSDNPVDISNVRETIKKQLPYYMEPNYIMQIDRIPITPNGKVDKKTLSKININDDVEYVKARNEKEQVMLEVFREVLGVADMGIRHNFFHLGGDSIKAIQIIGKLQQKNYKLEMNKLFEYNTIETLSDYVIEQKNFCFQGIVTGEARLTPIQTMLLENDKSSANQYNHSILLFQKEEINAEAVNQSFKELVAHHDALRMIYKWTKIGVIAINRDIDCKSYLFEVVDCSNICNYKLYIKKEVAKTQTELNLETGILSAVKIFKTQEGDYISFTIHHMVIDGVSWRILLEDFQLLYQAHKNGKEAKLPLKTNSFIEWSDALYDYSCRITDKETTYWNEIINNASLMKLPIDHKVENRLMADNKTQSITFDKELTYKLINNVNRAFNTNINDILIAALALALSKWSGSSSASFMMEGHGREKIDDSIDVSRTVGWFTSFYPVFIKIPSDFKLDSYIKNVKENIRLIPNRGIGYSLLSRFAGGTSRIDVKKQPQIIFNYLGQGDQSLDNSELSNADIEVTNTIHPNIKSNYSLSIDGLVLENSLSMNFTYNRCEFNEVNIAKLVEYFYQNLRLIVEYCAGREQSVKTLSDYSTIHLTEAELDRVTGIYGDDEIEDIYPLSPMQEGMLFHWILNREMDMYCEQYLFDMNGTIDESLLKKSIEQLINRHEILRTAFVFNKLKQPHQVVLRHLETEIEVYDYSDMQSKDKKIEELRVQQRRKGFDLTKGGAFRIVIVRTSHNSFKILFSFHHILMDGWCVQILMDELFEIYASIKNNIPVDMPEAHQFKEYIAWLDKQDRKEHLEFWSNYTKKAQSVTVLPYQNADENINNCNINTYNCSFNKKITDGLKNIVISNNTTLYNVFQCIWGVLLSKYNMGRDVAFGTVVSGRTSEVKGIEKMIGLFINTVPVIMSVENKQSFRTMVLKMQKAQLSIDRHSVCTLADIQNQSRMGKDLISNIVIFENYPVNEKLKSEDNFKLLGFNCVAAKGYSKTNYDFSLMIIPDDELQIQVDYNSNKFKEKSIVRIIEHLTKVAQTVVDNCDIRIEDIDIVTDEDIRFLQDKVNNTICDIPNMSSIHDTFAKKAEIYNNKIALEYKDEKLTYQQVDLKSDAVARELIRRGLRGNQIVGVLMNRSCNMILTLLGILKAGAAYVPIDGSNPKQRIEYILKNSDAKFLFVDESNADKIEYNGSKIPIKDIVENAVKTGDDINYRNNINDLAYMIYTSGSTGKPKAVCIEHKSVINFINGIKRALPFNEDTVMLCITTIAFDIFVLETFASLILGCKVVIADEAEQINPDLLADLIVNYHVTAIQMTPSRIRLLLESEKARNALKQIKFIVIGGENLSLSIVEELKRITSAKIFNFYGPTETTVWSTYCDVTSAKQISIGKPLMNQRVYVIDDNNHLVPTGIEGELAIGGLGLARGYYKEKELTESKFIHCSFAENERIYKTGDIVKLLPDGNVQYIGRKDFQVKIRGYRIETGEIETQIKNEYGLKDIVVVPVKRGEEYALATYYVADEDINTLEVRSRLAKKLPAYMIPDYYIRLESIPLNQSGKVDRKALPAINLSNLAAKVIVKPENQLEEKLVRIWSNILEVEEVSTEDNFFELGGHSLKAIKICSQARNEGINLSINDIFQYSTIKEIVQSLGNTSKIRYDIKNKNELDNYLQEQNVHGKYLEGKFDAQNLKILLLEMPIRDEKYGMMVNKINTSASMEIRPDYIWLSDMMKSDISTPFESLCRKYFKKIDTGSVISELRHKLEKFAEQFKKQVFGGKIIREFSISGTQKIRLKNPQLVIHTINIKSESLENISKAVLHIINEQGLLRSVLIEESGKLLWREYGEIDKLDIPSVDLSVFEPTGFEHVIREIVKTVHGEDMNVSGAMFRIVHIKENNNEGKIVIAFNHIIFDGYCLSVFKTRLKQLLNPARNYNKLEVKQYHEYVESIAKGPVDVTQDELIYDLKLKEFARSLEQVKSICKKYDNSETTTIMVELDASGNTDCFNIAFRLFEEFSANFFGIKDLPLLLITFAREYEDKYYGTLGEFIDYVPVFYQTGSDVTDPSQKFTKVIEFTKKHNINFAELLFNPLLKAKYFRLTKLIGNIFDSNFFVFNFEGIEGNAGNENYAFEENTDKYDSAVKFISKVLGNKLCLNISIPFKTDKSDEIKNFLRTKYMDIKKRSCIK
jgi:amino acid adenylation domain-containing protein/non-ribosomal peptide synthase protein (TIGR01720 family)